MSARPLILLEFNELSPKLMTRFIEEGKLPNFARLKGQSYTFTTDAGEDPPNLNPWIQWVTLHSGRPFEDHGVFHLGDAARKDIPMLWDVVCGHGHSAWICGSMNISVQPGFKGWVLPDPWDARTEAQPAELNRYIRLVRSYVMEYTSNRRPVTIGTALDFGMFMLQNGMRARTVWKIVKQLVSERTGDTKWKRATILDSLQFDLFRSVYKRQKPMLSTLFYNSTAHFQHVYWRNMEPQLFAIKPSEAEQRAKKDAVLFGYQEMDRIVGEVLDLAGNEAVVAFATALSQQPCLGWEEDGGKTFYKARSIPKMLEFMGLDPAKCRVEPVMSEQFHLRFESPAAAEAGKTLLDSVTLEGGRQVFYSRLEGDSVFAGCAFYDHLPTSATMRSPKGSAAFGDIFYQVESLKSGMHHRDGMLWIRIPGRQGLTFPDHIALTEAMPLLLRSMGLENPSWMPQPKTPSVVPGDLLTA